MRKTTTKLSKVVGGVKRGRTDAVAPGDDAAQTVLKEQFGLSDFRHGQRTIIDALLNKESALAIFPTGGGKSLCYQLPALLFPPRQLTLVISPLIALMKDQVDALKSKGIEADMLGSSQTLEQRSEVRRRIADFTTRILFVAPEQMNNEGTRAMVCSQKIALIAIDEAHCISEWGHAFRPDYLRLAKFAKDCAADRVLCLTATATPRVEEDIRATFGIKPTNSVRTTFHRHNLSLSFREVSDQQRDAHLINYLKTSKVTGPTIIYATTQETTAVVAQMLVAQGLPARFYHAGMEADVRSEVQDWFMGSNDAIVVATIAFGMGIDKANIRRVVHYNLPKSLEGYAQEIGRAGRDGLPSECRLLYCPSDMDILENFARCDSPSVRNIRKVLEDFYWVRDGIIGLKPGSIREVGQATMARENDLQENVVRMLLAFMDIYHGLIETLTPKYSTYKLQSARGLPLSSFRETINRLVSPNVAQALSSMLVMKQTWAHLDLDQRTHHGVPREQLLQAIRQLEDSGEVKVFASGVLQVFKINALPASINELARAETIRFSEREAREMDRLNQVVHFITTTTECQSAMLMKHFGEQPAKEWACTCESCKGGGKVKKGTATAMSRRSKMSAVPASAWAVIADAVASGTLPSDDPRLLTRVAIGTKSPRITKLRLVSHPAFGSLQTCSFESVLARCEKLCGRKDSDL